MRIYDMEGFTNDRRDLYTLSDILSASARSILLKLFRSIMPLLINFALSQFRDCPQCHPCAQPLS